MSYAATENTSTWAFGTAFQRLPEWQQAKSLSQPFLLPARQTLQGGGTALGAITPRTVRADMERWHRFTDSLVAGANLAAEMVAADEMDPPDPDIWRFAVNRLKPLATILPPPLVDPLQLGGVTFEWHEQGMNVELRFRGIGDVFVVIEDARGEVPNFHARDPGLLRAIGALSVLLQRQS